MWKSAKKKKPARPSFPSIDWSQQSLSLSLHNFCQLGQHLFQVQTAKKKVRSPLHIFCKLAHVPGSDHKKKVGFFLHILSKLTPVPGSERKNRCDPPPHFSKLAPVPGSDRKKSAIFSPHFE